MRFQSFIASCLLGAWVFSPLAQAMPKVGDLLPALAFDTEPEAFYYMPNGSYQMISVYQASISSSRNGKFNAKVIRKGFCPVTLIDIKNRAWYVPAKAAEDFVQKSIESDEHNPVCRTSIDYDGLALDAWNLEKKSTTMVVDGNGQILFLGLGVLSEEEEKAVIQLMRKGAKPFAQWPGNPDF